MKPTYNLKNAVRFEQGGTVWYEGNVYGNPKFEDGAYIHTSTVVATAITLGTGKPSKIVTQNSQYILDEGEDEGE